MLLRYIRPHWHLGAILFVLLLGSTSIQLLGPKLLGSFVDGIATGVEAAVLTWLGIAFIVTALVSGIGRVAVEWLGGKLAWRSTNALREDLLAHCLNQDLDFYDTHSPGELIERVDSDVERLSRFASQLLILLSVNVLLILGITVMLWNVDWRIGAGFTVVVAVALGLLRRLVGAAVAASVKVSQASATMSGHLEERLRGLEDLVPNGGADQACHDTHVLSAKLFQTSRDAAKLQARWPATAQHCNSAALVAGLAGAVALYGNGSITIGAVYSVVAYLTMMRLPMFVIATQMAEIDRAMAALRRSRELLSIHPVRRTGSARIPTGALAVEFHEVSFGYGPTPVLSGVSLALKPGRHLALVGASGGGKSTLARLAAQVVTPDSGKVTVGGVDLTEADPESLHRAIGYVTQEVRILSATVRDNVTVFDDSISDERVRQALIDTGLGGWLEALPEGLETTLGVTLKLSAGQEQLLSIARVLLRDPGLVILDEATARVAPGDRERIGQAIATLLHGRTAIIIAHRLDTVRNADEIAVVSHGHIVEHDRHDVLRDTAGSRFQALLAAGEAK